MYGAPSSFLVRRVGTGAGVDASDSLEVSGCSKEHDAATVAA